MTKVISFPERGAGSDSAPGVSQYMADVQGRVVAEIRDTDRNMHSCSASTEDTFTALRLAQLADRIRSRNGQNC